MLSVAGDIASVLGFPLALVGIIISIREAVRAKRAAEGAREAANEALARIKSLFLADQVGGPLRSVRDIDAACTEGDWDKAVRSCRDASGMLARFGQNSLLTLEEREAIGRMVDWLGEIQAHARKLGEKPQGRGKLPKTRHMQLHEIAVTLSTVQGRLESSAMEV